MHKSLFLSLYLLIFVISGCAAVGPDPDDRSFTQAIVNFAPAQDADLSMPGEWYPNQIIQPSWGARPDWSQGRLFVTQDSLEFALYDKKSNSYLQAFKVFTKDITWIAIRERPFGTFITLQTNGMVSSFRYSDGVDRTGKPLLMKDINTILAARFNAKVD